MNFNQIAQKQDALNHKLNQTLMNTLKAVHTTASPDDREALSRQRLAQDVLGRLVSPPIGFGWETFSIGHIPAAWVRPDRGHDRSRIILYCHGGGYTSGNLGYARVLAAKMAGATGCAVLAFQYRLAPEFPYPAALHDALAVWDHLMLQGWGARQVILAGDSAGGNLALELTLALRDSGRQLPGKLVLFSPWTDMTASSPTYDSCASTDPMLTADYIRAVRSAYAPDADYRLPAYSPLFADLHDFPPTLIQVGGREILNADATGLHERLIAAQVPSVLACWPDLWHVFQMFPLRSAAQAMTGMAEFINR